MLVNSKVNCSKGAPAQLLLYYILVDPMYRTAIVLAIGIFRACMQCFLDLFCTRLFALVVSDWTFIGWGRPALGGLIISYVGNKKACKMEHTYA